ncbi:DNA-binding protein [Rodentibacter caecimuris]|uniref:DNA-binding protein n=1 Tax=Rodentibacter caecimuris TaxID=1796644 RepID=A0A9X8W0S4_9PAST|nr:MULTISPECIES: KilA-N domain-containing protein [Pasteurellaceae]AOF54260.1 Phage tail fiber protein [Pasteurellaceae bacterium NI1060]MCQ9122904.1 KilA-N domain-containing protein [Rodentibacter heylii]MCR1838444.1 KilA-N domain-containing protein [Pasteurella caecimuris]MCU0107736.1 KilA-N domain-containing protein [Pasteurella caecimuris]OOF70025.1 DNA-binding protein [Rodentibacter heylii]
MSNLTILNTKIRSLDGLFSLNDLHVVCGNDPKHRPNQFMRLDTTQGLIAEIDRSANSQNSKNSDAQICASVKIVRGGRNPELQGTWVCEALVLAYATWISPKFHLIVLRAFLAMHRNEPKQLALPEPDYRIDHISQSEEALALFIRMYSFCFQAHEMQEKLRGTNIPKQMENEIGGQYLYNFKYPLEQTMAKAKQFIQSNTERLALVKAFQQLLD